MKKICVLLAIVISATWCQHGDASEPVLSHLRALGRYTGWGWSYRGYHQSCSQHVVASCYGNEIRGGAVGVGRGVSITHLPPPAWTAAGATASVNFPRTESYVAWLPANSPPVHEGPFLEPPQQVENYRTHIAELPVEKRQFIQPPRLQ